MTPIAAYQEFLAVKQHFSSKYDYHLYNGQINISVDSFQKRKDNYRFKQLAGLPDPKTRILACVLSDITWISDVLSAKGAKAESDYQKVVQSFSYAFKSFLAALKTSNKSFADLFTSSVTNPYPYLAELFIENKVPIQFVIALDDLLKFLPRWEAVLEPILWEPYSKKIAKYRPFFDYDKEKTKGIFLSWAGQNT